jgi:hypothetical protein
MPRDAGVGGRLTQTPLCGDAARIGSLAPVWQDNGLSGITGFGGEMERRGGSGKGGWGRLADR